MKSELRTGDEPLAPARGADGGHSHRSRTLWLCGVLHGFTHLYMVALLPLYLLIQEDLKLESVAQATLMVTVMMVAYFLPSYPMGVLADRVSRKRLLWVGLAIHALGFMGLAFAPGYVSALCCVAVAGFGGSFYHPAATALVAQLYPANTGRALGLVGVGASAGFFVGPIYAGWRAASAGWRAPVLELGIAGCAMAALFAWLAEDHPSAAIPSHRPAEKMFTTPALWFFFVLASLLLSLRDFAGSSMGSLGSLFLQKAHGMDPRTTGLALSAIFLAGVISNPLFGHLSDRGRMRWTSLVLAVAAVAVAVFPHVPKRWVIPTLVLYGFFFMASYPMIEAALMLSVPDSVRGRVFGLFITIGGLVGNWAHWLAGVWVKGLGERAAEPAGYYGIYGGLGLLVLTSLAALPCLHAIRKREGLEPDKGEK